MLKMASIILAKSQKTNMMRMRTILGKGPVGHYELVTIVSTIARELQSEGFIEKQFGKKIPIIVHGLEYTWYDMEATRNANPNGEAETFLKACKELEFC